MQLNVKIEVEAKPMINVGIPCLGCIGDNVSSICHVLPNCGPSDNDGKDVIFVVKKVLDTAC